MGGLIDVFIVFFIDIFGENGLETLGFNSPSLNPENELPQWQQKIANAENKYSSIANNIWVRMDFLHEVQFSAGIGPAHFPAETTRPLGIVHMRLRPSP
jgi:hypothetical protein